MKEKLFLNISYSGTIALQYKYKHEGAKLFSKICTKCYVQCSKKKHKILTNNILC